MLKKTGAILLLILILLSVIPFLIPVTHPSEPLPLPFANSRYDTINGVRLHYRTWTPVEPSYKGKTLLVHGLGGSTFSWRKNIETLTAQGYLVVAVDLPGFGYSDRKKGINASQENRSVLLWGLIDIIEKDLSANNALRTASGQIEEKNTWNLVGHSMGGGTVTAMVLHRPEQTRSLVYVDGAVLSSGSPTAFLFYYPPIARWAEVLGRLWLLKENKIVQFLKAAYGSDPTPEDTKGYLDPLLQDGTEGTLVDMIKTSTRIKEERLKEIKTPVFGIWGEKDTWVPVAEADKLKIILKDMDFRVISDAWHCPMETHAPLFNQFLLEALAP